MSTEVKKECRCLYDIRGVHGDLDIAVERILRSGVFDDTVKSYLEAYRNGLSAFRNRFDSVNSCGKKEDK